MSRRLLLSLSQNQSRNDQIEYTSSDGNIVTPYATDVFGANIVSNLYDAEKECWVITFDGVVTEIGYNAFSNCTNLTSITIPESVTGIGTNAFNNCSSLISVTIPDSVETIRYGTFNNCSSLTSVTIGNGVTSIGQNAFNNCTSLINVTIPNSVTEILNWAFGYCSSLTSVTIPDSVTKIDSWTFSYCGNLSSVYCLATTPPTLGHNYAFDGNKSGRKFYVPVGSVDAYKSAQYWSVYTDAIVGYDFENNIIV